MRESLRIGRESLEGGGVGVALGTDGTPASKKMKLNGGTVTIGVGGALNGNIVPLTLTAKKNGGSATRRERLRSTQYPQYATFFRRLCAPGRTC